MTRIDGQPFKCQNLIGEISLTSVFVDAGRGKSLRVTHLITRVAYGLGQDSRSIHMSKHRVPLLF